MPENIEVLDGLIVGRVQPHIYAFSTEAIPNYLKIGDTYRPVSVRLNEWKRYFPTLKEEYREQANVGENVFFRDYAVHQYLENELRKTRLLPTDFDGTYYSNEFFKDITTAEISDAIDDIKVNFEKRAPKYQYYDMQNRLQKTYTYVSTGMWQPRPNQQETINNFMAAVKNGRTNLLMYAVMRFGKSFTSLCCAKEMGAKKVVVVSAKVDVREEWKKTVQQADNFNKDYVFLTSEVLADDEHIMESTVDSGKGVILFLSLQDLQGEKIKEKHKEIFSEAIDLLIIDETHYGARAEKYGQILRDANYVKDMGGQYTDDYIDYTDAEKGLKVLNPRIKLHLSGTPYRILMGGEFAKEDIVAFYQFTDIVADQEKWDFDHLLSDNVREWDNPYYGFPQMVRFAFHPSKAAQARLKALKANGNTYAFSALLKPKSVRKSGDGLHKAFVYEREVLDLFEVIDGSKLDDELLSFLDYNKIKEGNMCRHIVCVLPYCASCDALETLLQDNRDKFKNLQNYEIINISGVDTPRKYRSVAAVKEKIETCQESGKKTITLTVGRMLTGSTVEQWDTMLFLKDTASPQEYDQAIFRLQNQYIKTLTDESGDVIKFNMKPQTLLVDFDPHRMFSMQEQKSLLYNVNTEEDGNQKLEERLKEELRISPMITMIKNKLSQVEPTDILHAISAYSKDRGVIDETREIPVDLSLLDIETIKTTIESQAELGSRRGLEIDAHTGDGFSDMDEDNCETSHEDNPTHTEKNPETTEVVTETDRARLENKFRMYYSRLLFYAFLSNDHLSSLDTILASFSSIENMRIARNLSLETSILQAIRTHINPFILRQLDYKIQNINALSHDETITPVERAIRAIHKFGKLSESEVPTPLAIAHEMIGLLPDDCFFQMQQKGTAILDIASKIGEFPIAIYEKALSLGIAGEKIRSSIRAIPTSSVAYEFTRKIYTMLGLDISCIAANFTSYALLDMQKSGNIGEARDELDCQKIANVLKQNEVFSVISLDDAVKEGEKMEFEAIVGNPPYQVSDGGARASAKPIYHKFVEISKSLSPKMLTIIMPSRWYAGGKGLDSFRDTMMNDPHIEELHDFLHPEEVFPATNNRGGICYFLWNADYDNRNSKVNVVSHMGDGEVHASQRKMKVGDLNIFIRDNTAVSILDKILVDGLDMMSAHVSPRKPFGIESNITATDAWHKTIDGLRNPIRCYGKGRKTGFIKLDGDIKHQEWAGSWKVFTPRANNVGTELGDDNLNTFIGEPNSICTEAYLVIGATLSLNEQSAFHLATYFNTKFVRFLHGIAKASHDASRKTFRFVPCQNFANDSDIRWNQTISEIDAQLYEKYKLTRAEICHIESKIKLMKETER